MAWYPSARVFRQTAYGDWTSVIERIVHALLQRRQAGRLPA
jgi:hypothetical protein